MCCSITFCCNTQAHNCSIIVECYKVYITIDTIIVQLALSLVELGWCFKLPCSYHILERFHQVCWFWHWQIQEKRGAGVCLISRLHICKRILFVSRTMVTRTAVDKSCCLIGGRYQKRSVHSACDVVLFLFYVCTIDTLVRVKNWEDQGLTIVNI